MAQKRESLTFQIADIRFSKDGWHSVRSTNGDNISGKFNAQPGMCYKSTGYWESHPQYGPQYKIDSAEGVRMTSVEALGRFLTLQMKGTGVGEAVISLLVEGVRHDKRDLEMMLDRGQRDELIDYVGKRNAKKIDLILDKWPEIKPQADLMSPLLGYGLSEAQAETLIGLYGNRVLEEVETRPYNMILAVDGISFLTADRVAMKAGFIKQTDPIRMRAALSTGMRDATTNGDVGVRRKTLLDKTLPLVNESVLENGKRKLAPGVPLVVPPAMLAEVLDNMIKGVYQDTNGDECGFSSHLVEFPDDKGETVVWYAPLVEAEQLIARRLSKFNVAPRPDLVAHIDVVLRELGVTLEPEQRAAVEMVLLNPASVITGGPGCGKSFVLKIILAIFDYAKLQGNQGAPTGKAAKRITESTGRMAQTQHSLICFQPGGGAKFNQFNPLVAEYLVIDEASMDDVELMAATLDAVTNGCRIIIVGDVDQLPSVGPGQVLRDIIRSGTLPVTRLVTVRRQGPGSGIVTAAKIINSGHVPETTDDGEFVVVNTETPAQELLNAFRALVDSGVNPDDIQVLAPTHRGDAGCVSLNKAVQSYLNPEPAGGTQQRLRRDSGDIRVGDRVIQNKNNKNLGIVNGDIGFIDDIILADNSVLLGLMDRLTPITMENKDTTHLKLAYAITVHKSQGAEAPYVLLALDPSATFMLRRNLVYTGVTRGSKRVMVFGSRNTLASAVHRGEPAEGSRRTTLYSKLLATMPKKVSATSGSLAKLMLSGEPDIEF